MIFVLEISAEGFPIPLRISPRTYLPVFDTMTTLHNSIVKDRLRKTKAVPHHCTPAELIATI
jgi:hypothetical protein